MTTIRSSRLIFAVSLFMQSGGQPIAIPIQNPSFEEFSIVSTDRCGNWSNKIPGWNFGPGDALFQPTGTRCGTPIPPDGSVVLSLDYSTVSQDLGVKPSELQAKANNGYPGDGLYVLTFYATNLYPVYPGYWEPKLSLGTTDTNGVIHIEQDLCATDSWKTSGYVQGTLVCTVPRYLVYGQLLPSGAPADRNAHLILSLVPLDGWPILIDDFSLKFAPLS